MKKKLRLPAALIMSLMLAFGLAAAPVAAASAPKIEDIEYEGKGKVEVDFYGHVKYHKCKVTVKDTNGKSYKANVLKKDDDDITFKIKGYKTGTTYKFTIKGIKKRGASSYTKVKGKVKIPASGKVAVKSVEYDRGDKEVSFDFKGKVKWSNPTVSITKDGTEYCTRILEKENDSIEVKVKEMDYGAKYSYKITGVANKDGGGFTTVTGTFKAVDRD